MSLPARSIYPAPHSLFFLQLFKMDMATNTHLKTGKDAFVIKDCI